MCIRDSFKSGELDSKGSLEKTSIAAPAINDLFKASAKASSSIKPPRAQLINFALLFILLSTSIFTKFSVSGVRGKCKDT